MRVEGLLFTVWGFGVRVYGFGCRVWVQGVLRERHCVKSQSQEDQIEAGAGRARNLLVEAVLVHHRREALQVPHLDLGFRVWGLGFGV